jgi:uncharacterized protein (DUF2249 family)
LGIFLARDAAWATGCLNERVDRPIIRYLFNQEPRAWLAIMPPLDESAEEDLKSVQTLVPMGLRISLAEAYRRFRWKAPAAGEECLSVGKQKVETAKDEASRSRHTSNGGGPLPASPGEGGAALRGEAGAADRSAEQAIGAGANPKAVVQTASGLMPDPQVDAASFYCNQS